MRITLNRILDQGPDGVSDYDAAIALWSSPAPVVTGNRIRCFGVPVEVDGQPINPCTFGPNAVSNAGCP